MSSRKLLFFFTSVFLLVGISALPILSNGQATISATVTPELISVYLNRPQVDYGTVPLNRIAVPPPGDPITNIQNNGTVTENFSVTGSDAVFNTNTWQIDDVPGANQFVHEFQKQAGDTNWYSLSDVTPRSLAGNLAVGASADIKLRISTPTSITGEYGQYTATVVILAVKS